MIKTLYASLTAAFALVSIGTASAVTYTENFDNLASGLPAGWTVSSNATATTIGNQNATYNPAQILWSSTTGQFGNYASATGLTAAATAAEQNASTNRALAERQTGAFGDPGVAFNFNFSTTGATVSALSIDLQMLSVQTRSTAFTLQYGVGPSPSTFTTLGTYNDPGVFGSTSFAFTNADFGTALDNQANVTFRIVALTASAGSGSRDTVGIDNFSLTSSAPITPVQIPEPATYMLLGMGALVCGQRFLRRKQS